jgi:hypothetical protein
LYRLTFPFAPSLAITRREIVAPGATLRFDVGGTASPEGKAVMNVAALGRVTPTFSTTADTPLPGTPPTPVTVTSTMPSGPTAALGAPMASRVSSTRAGLRAWNWAPSLREPSSNQPTTSATRSTVPAALNRRTAPPTPTLAATMLFTTVPGSALRLDASGVSSPVGWTVT